jgi:hypothetical protein
MDMHVNPIGAHFKAMPEPEHSVRGDELQVDDARLDELTRWHGTDESNLPPAASLKNLARDTVEALHELQRARITIDELRAAMGRAFWATEFVDVHAILLRALGPPPGDLDA